MKRLYYIFFLLFLLPQTGETKEIQNTAVHMADAAMPLLLDPNSSSLEKRVGEILLTGSMDAGESVEMDATASFSPKSTSFLKAHKINEPEFQKRVIKGDLTGARELIEETISPVDDLSDSEEESAQSMARRVRQGVLFGEHADDPFEEKEEAVVPDLNKRAVTSVNVTSESLDSGIRHMQTATTRKVAPKQLYDDERLRAFGIRSLPGVSIFRLAHHKITGWHGRNNPAPIKRPKLSLN
jgi:hypothetical protein